MPDNVSSLLPPWMTYIEGEVPVVLVAPHGGRRPADAPIQDSIKVNDLHTAELTTLLATRTCSYAFINHALDRNDLDLNRISQVRARAPWFLEALVALLSALAEKYGTVRVFFIHGWNVVQPVCDLGMGLKQRGDLAVPCGKAAPTLSADFFDGVVLPFRIAALAQGIDVAIGRRYPAADKDNFMQVFSARFAEEHAPLVRTLAGLSTRGKINAVQLELGVGLRWPGPEREHFIEVFSQTLGNCMLPPKRPQQNGQPFSLSPFVSPPLAASHRTGSPLSLHRIPEPTRLGLHFHDQASGLGIMGGVEFDGSAPTSSGRLLVSLGGTEMVMFTGEDDTTSEVGTVRVGRFVWRQQADGLAISYHGTVMRFSHPQAFIRLEEGLAASWIEPAQVSLHLTLPQSLSASPLPLFLAHLRGEIRLCDRTCEIDAWGFVDMLRPEEAGRLLPRRQLSLPFGPDLAVFLSWVETPDGARSSGVLYHRGTPYPLQPEDWELRYTLAQGRPSGFQLSLIRPRLLTLQCSGETLTAIPIVRHAPRGKALDVTFGLSRSAWQGQEAYGVYEFSERRRS
jgi:hypothetical protein